MGNFTKAFLLRQFSSPFYYPDKRTNEPLTPAVLLPLIPIKNKHTPQENGNHYYSVIKPQ